MPRLFTGLEIPPHETRELAALRGGLPGARWVEPEDYHITLRFIGEVGVSLANEIARELDGLRTREINVTIERLWVFGSDRPRSIVAQVKATDAFCGLQAEHERLMRRLGLRAEHRKFLPHVTLARVRNASAQDAAAYIESRGAFTILGFVAPRFVLYSSKDSVGGGPYRVEAAYPA
ncbi:MAG: RNA 2',3'-cyclic phosphodiesterase [Beijerinckiaceae bacterium]